MGADQAWAGPRRGHQAGVGGRNGGNGRARQAWGASWVVRRERIAAPGGLPKTLRSTFPLNPMAEHLRTLRMSGRDGHLCSVIVDCYVALLWKTFGTSSQVIGWLIDYLQSGQHLANVTEWVAKVSHLVPHKFETLTEALKSSDTPRIIATASSPSSDLLHLPCCLDNCARNLSMGLCNHNRPQCRNTLHSESVRQDTSYIVGLDGLPAVRGCMFLRGSDSLADDIARRVTSGVAAGIYQFVPLRKFTTDPDHWTLGVNNPRAFQIKVFNSLGLERVKDGASAEAS